MYTPKLKMGTIEVSDRMELVSIDIWNATTVSRSGNKYVLTVIDGFSKFALPDKSEKSIAQALCERVFSS